MKQTIILFILALWPVGGGSGEQLPWETKQKDKVQIFNNFLWMCKCVDR